MERSSNTKMIKLKLPGIGVVTYYKNKPPDTIYFESLSGNRDFNSIIFAKDNNKFDFEYDRKEKDKLFKLKEDRVESLPSN